MSLYRAICIDLFWTTVDLDFERFPVVSLTLDGNTRAIPSSGNLLFAELQKHKPGLERQSFLENLWESRKRIRQQWESGVTEEIASVEKFYDLLEELSIFAPENQDDRRSVAERLTAIHMDCIVNATTISQKRKAAIEDLGQNYDLALVSNFDHAPAGYEILDLHGLSNCFQKVVISEEIGKRKPHPKLFEEALQALGVEPREALMVGDTPLDDIIGAQRMGMDTAWVQRKGVDWPSNQPPPTHTMTDLAELPLILKRS